MHPAFAFSHFGYQTNFSSGTRMRVSSGRLFHLTCSANVRLGLRWGRLGPARGGSGLPGAGGSADISCGFGSIEITSKPPTNCPCKRHAGLLARDWPRVGESSVRAGFQIQPKKAKLLIFCLLFELTKKAHLRNIDSGGLKVRIGKVLFENTSCNFQVSLLLNILLVFWQAC